MASNSMNGRGMKDIQPDVIVYIVMYPPTCIFVAVTRVQPKLSFHSDTQRNHIHPHTHTPHTQWIGASAYSLLAIFVAWVTVGMG